MVMKITIMASYTFLIIENIKNKIFNKIYLAIVLGETGQIFKYYKNYLKYYFKSESTVNTNIKL